MDSSDGNEVYAYISHLGAIMGILIYREDFDEQP